MNQYTISSIYDNIYIYNINIYIYTYIHICAHINIHIYIYNMPYTVLVYTYIIWSKDHNRIPWWLFDIRFHTSYAALFRVWPWRRYLAEDVVSAAPIPAFPDTWRQNLREHVRSQGMVISRWSTMCGIDSCSQRLRFCLLSWPMKIRKDPPPFNPGIFVGDKTKNNREIFHLTTWNIPPSTCFLGFQMRRGWGPPDARL